jgi:hypothetical protein
VKRTRSLPTKRTKAEARRYQRAYRRRDPVLKRLRDAEYHANNREKRCAAMRAYHARTKDQRHAVQAAYRRTHRVELALHHRAYYWLNRDAILERKHRREA